jgi:exonuclease III
MADYTLHHTGADVLGVQETKRAESLIATAEPNRVICAEDPTECGDPGAGVAIILSKRAANLIIASGHVGCRLVWCRIKGPLHNILFVNAYIPYKGHVHPQQSETLEDLRSLLRQLLVHFPQDCITLVGDFNSRLPRSIKDLTGRFAMHPRSDCGGSILLDIMREFSLVASSTFFSPRRSSPLGSATYIGKNAARTPHQIDYILVSKRWASSIQDSKVEWRHSIHRFGHKHDHGLIKATFRFRIRKKREPPLPIPDFSSLIAPYGEPPPAAAIRFDNTMLAITSHLPPPVTTAVAYTRLADAIQAAATELPPIPNTRRKKLSASLETAKLYEDRKRAINRLTRGSPAWRQTLKNYGRAIAHSHRRDKRNFTADIVNEIATADLKRDSKAVWQGVHKLSGKFQHKRSKQPSKTATGTPITSTDELCKLWTEFSTSKFARTSTDSLKGDRPSLPPSSTRLADIPSYEDLQLCLSALANRKALGPDDIPAEVYKGSRVARSQLFDLVISICSTESVPQNLPEATFITIFKNKGSTDDPTKYRFIALLNHAYKLLSAYLLLRLAREVESKLPSSQAGFRKKFRTVDNVYILTRLMDQAIATEKDLVVTFIDFVAAFDSVSHHFLDEALQDIGASDKSRALFRGIYDVATARIRVPSPDGPALGPSFPINRGVLQGDIFSPYCFIIALAVIVKRHGYSKEKLGAFGILISILEYADDAALADSTPAIASERITRLATGARADAGMEISVPKTMSMHVRPDADLGAPPEELYDQLDLPHSCPLCGRSFPKHQGMALHKAVHCKKRFDIQYENEFAVSLISDVRGAPGHFFYLVKWAGEWPPEQSHSWRSIPDLANAQDQISAFWATSPLDPTATHEHPQENRCVHCCDFFKRPQDLKTHLAKPFIKGGCKQKPVLRKGTLTEKLALKTMQALHQASLPRVACEGAPLNNVYRFDYLGISLQANGDKTQAAICRMAIAKTAFGQLRHLWADASLSLSLKLMLYQCGILSILSYGAECWDLSPALLTLLQQWNSRCLSAITAREIPDEYRTPTLDLIANLQARRLRWLGHTLRCEESHLAHTFLVAEIKSYLDTGSSYPQGSPLALLPSHSSIQELLELARDRPLWQGLVRLIYVPVPLKHSNRHAPTRRNPPRACRPPPGSLRQTESGAPPETQRTRTLRNA